MSVRIKGLTKVVGNYNKRINAITASAIVNKSAAIVESHAKRLVPVDTGDLRRSIKTDTASDLGGKAEASVYTDLEYAMHQEFGTRNQPAQSFMHPAAQQSRSKVNRVAQEEIKKAMKV